jgi:hypothetical protein
MAGASVQWWWDAWRRNGENRLPTEHTDYTEQTEVGGKEGIA